MEWKDTEKKHIAYYFEDAITAVDIERLYDEYTAVEVWYPTSIDNSVYDKYGSLLAYIELDGHWNGDSYSFVNDLTKSEDEIFNNIYKSLRYQINRSQNKDKITINYIDNADSTIIAEYVNRYNQFIGEKGFGSPKDGVKELCLAQQNKLCLIQALDSDGKILVENAYLIGDETAFYYTGSSQRLEIDKDTAMIGRANKLLHYKAMLHFKKLGYKKYDFSGAYIKRDNEEFYNVTVFKERFGGKLTKYKSGFFLDLCEVSQIDKNLQRLKEKIISQNVIIWGYGAFGKYIHNLLKTEYNTDVSLIIDNKIALSDNNFFSDEILDTLSPEDYIVFVSMSPDVFREVSNQRNSRKFIEKNSMYCLRSNDL